MSHVVADPVVVPRPPKVKPVVQTKPVTKHKPKLGSRINMLIRRIHLYAGLFMLPWVLLYGFTAVLFNHPQMMTDSKTTIHHFQLDPEQMAFLPNADEIGQQVVGSALATLTEKESTGSLQNAETVNARFKGSIVGLLNSDDQNVTVTLDPNTGKGHLRIQQRTPAKTVDGPLSPEDKLQIQYESADEKQWTRAVEEILKPFDLKANEIQPRTFPGLEFDAVVNYETRRMRFVRSSTQARNVPSTPNSNRSGTDSGSATEANANQPAPARILGELFPVGSSPRDLSWRSYLTTLHKSRTYPNETNARWFWAIAVDAMFASMIFWGLSGVVMWWQIKRTRRIGFYILVASAVTATLLAINMHWQLVHG